MAWNPSVTEVDSDGDGFANSMEAKLGTNPFVATSKPSVPAALADAKLWFDAANVDGQNNSTLSSGSSVTTWKDLSNGNHDVSEATNAPALSYVGGRPYVAFDGSNDHLTGNLAGHILDNPAGQDMTIFTVVQPKSGDYIVSTGGQTGRGLGYALIVNQGSWIRYYYNSAVNGNSIASISDSFTMNETHLVSDIFNGGSNNNHSTNVNATAHVRSGSTIGSTNDFKDLTFGRPNNAQSLYGQFDLGEIH